MLKAIPSRDVHQMASAQVIVDLPLAVKELVENALDAGATRIGVLFKDHGVTALEVSDNGVGIQPGDHAKICQASSTSKLSTFEGLMDVTSYGFRGEALSSLCALGTVEITTAWGPPPVSATGIAEPSAPQPLAELQPTPEGRGGPHTASLTGAAGSAPVAAARLTFSPQGDLLTSTPVAAPRGTTITLTNLFHSLPVRQRDFTRNAKREHQKAMAVVQAYALIRTGVRFTCHHVTLSKKLLFATSGSSLKSNVMSLYGANGMTGLTPIELTIDTTSKRSDADTKLEATSEGLDSAVPPLPTSTTRASPTVTFHGYILSVSFGQGRSSTDRQLWYINSRPVSLPKFLKLVTEAYRLFNNIQFPVIILNIQVDPSELDINVTPDKRTVLLAREKEAMDGLREALHVMWLSQGAVIPRGKLAASQPPSRGDSQYTQGVLGYSGDSGDSQTGGGLYTEEPQASQTPRDGLTPYSGFSRGSRRATTTHEASSGRAWDLSDHSQGVGGDSQDGVVTLESTPTLTAMAPRTVPRRALKAFEYGAHTTTLNNASTTTSALVPGAVLSIGGRVFRESTARGKGQGLEFEELHPEVEKPDSTMGEAFDGVEVELEVELEGEMEAEAEEGALIEAEMEMAMEAEGPGLELELELDFDMLQAERDILEAALEILDAAKETPVQRYQSQSPRGVLSPGEGLDTEPLFVPEEVGKIDSSAYQRSDPPQRTSKRASPVQGDVSRERKKVFSVHEITRKTPAPPPATPASLFTLRASRYVHNLVTQVAVDVETLTNSLAATSDPSEQPGSLGSEGPPGGCALGSARAATTALAVPLTLTKQDFRTMAVVGQFNLGFIITTRTKADSTHLFIIDQHASDEKYNFEKLQRETLFQSQRLVLPQSLELNAIDELIVELNLAVFEKSGWKVEVRDGEPGRRIWLLSIPASKNTVFEISDFEELLYMIREAGGLAGDSCGARSSLRCLKVRAMFAMRACRSSVMIGKCLTVDLMRGIVTRLGELDKPWNCPHGRPTVRHLYEVAAQQKPAPPLDDEGEAGTGRDPDLSSQHPETLTELPWLSFCADY